MSALQYAPALTAAPVRRKRRLSKEATVAIGLSLLVHGAVFSYLATQKFADITSEVFPDPFTTTIEKLPPERPVKPTPAKPVTVRPITSDIPPPIDTKPIDTVPLKPDPVETHDPPVTFVPDPPPKGPVQIADARPSEPPHQRVIRNPSWLQRPTGRQLADLYPRMAAERGISGGATLMCEVIGTGAVRNCAVVDESPKGRGFGEAALASARLFKLNPRTVDGEAVEGAKVRIPLVFNLTE